MIRTHLKTLIITSALILLPIPLGLLLWERFPVGYMPNQFVAVWLMPLIMLASHWLCVLFTFLDPGHKGRNRKPLTMMLWIMPVVTWFCSGLMYALYMGLEFSMVSWTLALMGILFIAVGNYMPKTRMNYTMGIKVYWTYTSEENWTATHRFAGKLWVIGGIILLLGIFLPEGAAIALMIITIVILCVLPMLYSWRFWKKQKSEDAELKNVSDINPKMTKAALILLAVILVFCVSIMFSGDLKYSFSADGFTIHADWYSDITLQYEEILSAEYREGNIPGMRVGGFGSLRLLMGYFKNEEFGTHIRYSYYKPDACIILNTQHQIFVLSAKTLQETREIYDLVAKMIR